MKKGLMFFALTFLVLITALIILIDIPAWEKLDMEKIIKPASASIILDKDGKEAMTLSGVQNRIVLASSDIPPLVKNAFIAAEDARFSSHIGVDLRRIASAVLTNLKSFSFKEGASTITQQLIKLTHLSQEKKLSRKANEAYLAICLERKMNKDEILTSYLNTVYFGEGAYGIESAARTYFSKGAGALTLSEAALLAGILKAPSSYSPYESLEKALNRRNYVLNQMLSMEMITKDEFENASSESYIKPQNTVSRSFGWYRDMVISEGADALGITADELLSGGYTIHTNLDPALQEKSEALFEMSDLFPDNASDGTPVQAAFCSIDPASGAIRAVIGGRNYSVARGLNRAAQSKRQPGSALKPVCVYAAAVDAFSLTPTSLIDDSQQTFEGGYSPSNAGGKYYGLVTLRDALSKSLNVASVSLIEFTGISTARKYALQAGVSLAASDNGLSLALGSLTNGVTPLELSAAYAPLANGGMRVNAHCIEKISDRNGRTVYEFIPPQKRVMKAESAYLITSMLKSAASSGSAKALSNSRLPIAGKTGTVSMESGRNRDIWTVAYTENNIACIWMGFDKTDEVHSLPSWVGGSSYPAAFLSRFFKDQHAGDFKVPENVIKVSLDKYALENDRRVLKAPENAPSSLVTEEWFTLESAPVQESPYFHAPLPLTELNAVSIGLGKCEITFEIEEENADYLLFRETASGKALIFKATGNKGDTVRIADQFEGAYAIYTVISRNRRMHENGVDLFSAESSAVRVNAEKGFWKEISEMFG